MLTASVCVGTRSGPVASSACVKRQLARSQNLWEETFLRLVVDRLRAAEVSAIWLCVRGFHRVAWLKKFVEMEQRFVVRLQRDVTVHLPDGARLLKSLEMMEGESRDFGFVHLRADEFVGVRLSGVWAKGAKEVWWLATDLTNRVSTVVSYYDRRMGIEEQFRDVKGARLGMKLKWTQFTRAGFVERMYLLVRVALLLWTSIGCAVEESEPKTRLMSKTIRSATIVSAHRLLLLAPDDQANETDHSFCARASATATPQGLQVVDCSPKVISGQVH